MHEGEILADESTVRGLCGRSSRNGGVAAPVVASAGTDHAIYRLGHDKCVRCRVSNWAIQQAPKGSDVAAATGAEAALAVLVPIAIGRPSAAYPGRGRSLAGSKGRMPTRRGHST
jgi:hypothetical protein